ncbi:hypothetical protein Bbelb_017860 [Branchiostoma belcheri]|nr:hypothetical protein Bbelb_017860 [Branchiostoma belcheri]
MYREHRAVTPKVTWLTLPVHGARGCKSTPTKPQSEIWVKRADYTWRARIPGRSGREVSASGRLSDVYAYFDLSTAVGHSEPKEGLLRVMATSVTAVTYGPPTTPISELDLAIVNAKNPSPAYLNYRYGGVEPEGFVRPYRRAKGSWLPKENG